MEHLLEQNKELINHLQKLMIQLQQLQSLGLTQQQAAAHPPQSSTPIKDNPPSTGTPVAAAAVAPTPRDPSPIVASSAQQNGVSNTPPKTSPVPPDDNEVAMVPTMTSTPSPTPAQTSPTLLTIEENEKEGGEENVPTKPAMTVEDVGMDIKLDTSDFSDLGAFDIDIDLMTTSALPDDPFAPLPNTSNSDQPTSS